MLTGQNWCCITEYVSNGAYVLMKVKRKRKMEIKETNSQLIKQIMELCEAFGIPDEIKMLIKNKCWKLTKNKEDEGEDENVGIKITK